MNAPCSPRARGAVRGLSRRPIASVRLVVAANVALLASQLRAQTAPASDAARDWSALLTLTQPAVSPTTKTPVQVEAERPAKALQQRQAAAAAKDFYTKYPTDMNAAAAKKLEATYGLLGVLDGDATHETAAQLVAKTYRDNKTNPVADRFDVAALSERVSSRAKLGGKTFGRTSAELEKIADKLRVEFGDVQPVFNHYAGIARGADAATARRIATNLMQWPSGVAPRAEAQAMLERDALVGKPLNIRLTRTNSQTLDLAQPLGRKRLLYVWAPQAADTAPPKLTQFAGTLGDMQVVYLLIGVKTVRAQALAAAAPAGATVCFTEQGLGSPLIDGLKTRQAPYVYLFSAAGAVTSFGPVSELPNLLAAANR